jgi:endonuclease/exonuclease/phosphatase family metal-dependent hydrolase
MRNRLTVIAGACGLLLAGAAAAVAAPSISSAQAASTVAETGSARVRIATYNTEYGRTPEAVAQDIKNLSAAGADIIALQEMGTLARRDAVRSQLVDCPTCEFDDFMPDTAEENATPILYKWAKYRLLGTGTVKVSERTYVGSSGAGPNTLKAKFINYVSLRHRVTGQELYVLNNHAVPSVQGDGGGRNLDNPERLELYRQHMAGLRSLITQLKETGAAIFVTGDFNVNYRRDVIVQDKLFPHYNMGEVSVYASYKTLGMPEIGTHVSGSNDTRLIDYVFSLRHDAVTPRSQDILRGYGSDHRPVLVRYSLGG